MHSTLIAVLLLVAYCEARTSFDVDARPSIDSESAYIIGGEDAILGEFPWHLQLESRDITLWEPVTVGSATLISEIYVLTAAHLVFNRSPGSFRVAAGLINRASTDKVISYVANIKTHELYRRQQLPYYGYDIAILTLASPIYANGVTIQYAKLPENSDDLFVGGSGFITGWGRIDAAPSTTMILQKAPIQVIDTDTCNQLLQTFGTWYFGVDDTFICLLDSTHQATTCNGDNGGPFNLNNGSEPAIVAGLSSWKPQSENPYSQCRTGVPTMYTRTSAYLDWIKTNTP